MNKYIFSLMLLSGLVAAQETKNVGEVVIQGKFLNTPYQKIVENIEVITKKDIENAPAQSIADLLQQFSGLDIRRRGANGSQADISLRGGTYEQVLLLINGIPMNDTQTGHNSLTIPVDLSAVERIEVIKGPAGRRFGQNAYAGAINIITKTSSENKVKLSLEAGDFNTYSFGVNSTFGNDKIQNLLQANYLKSDGYRYNTDVSNKNVFYQGELPIQNGNVNLQAGFIEKKFGANGFYGQNPEQYEEVQASIVSMGYQQAFNNLSINSAVYWRRGQDTYIWIRNNPALSRNLHIGNNIGGQLNFSYKSDLGVTSVGTEIRNEGIVSNKLGKRDRFITQLFFEHNLSLLNDKLNITAGISWANYSNIGSYFFPGVDIGYHIDEHSKIYGNISKVHRLPSFTDLYYFDRNNYENPNLKTESAISMEVGYAYHKNDFSFKTSIFHRNSDNMIDRVRNTPPTVTTDKWINQNIGTNITDGIEMEASQYIPSIQSSFSASYTYLDNKNNSPYAYSRYVSENLKRQFVAKMENKLFKNFYSQLIYRHNQRQINNSSYNLLDEKLSFRKNNFEAFVLINNITNSNYTEGFGIPMPKRWAHIGVSYIIK